MNIQGLLGLVVVPKWRQKLGDVSTPKVVVDNLISKLQGDPIELLKQGETIVDPCCGHGSILISIANLAKKELDPLYIAKHLVGYDLNHADTAKKLLANELGINAEFIRIYQKDSLKTNMDIKNFRVIMNPPFNLEPGQKRDSAGNSNNSVLYQDFVTKFAGVAKQVISLNPAGWTIKTREVEKYKKIGLKEVEFLPANHFPTVTIRSGLTITNFIKDYKGNINIKTENGDNYEQSRNEKIQNISIKVKQILEKIEATSNLGKVVRNGTVVLPKGTKGSVQRACELSPNSFSLDASTKFSHKILAFVNDGKNLGWIYSAKSCKYSDAHKVVISSATSKFYLGNVVILDQGIGVAKNNLMIVVKNATQAKIYKDYLDSPLVKFIIKNVKFNDVVNTKTNSWNYIPALPIDYLEGLSQTKENFDLHSEIYKILNLVEFRTIIEDSNG